MFIKAPHRPCGVSDLKGAKQFHRLVIRHGLVGDSVCELVVFVKKAVQFGVVLPTWWLRVHRGVAGLASTAGGGPASTDGGAAVVEGRLLHVVWLRVRGRKAPAASIGTPPRMACSAVDGTVETMNTTVADLRVAELQRVLDAIAGAVRADGGELTLVDADPDTGVVTVELSGACSTCAFSVITLRYGVERILRERLDWITTVNHGVASAEDWEASASQGKGNWQPLEETNDND